MHRNLAVVIMAAGKGTRMRDPSMAKVMYTIGGKPMVEHVVDLAHHLKAKRIVVVVGWHKDSVINHLERSGHSVVCVEQTPQLGTGHAVMQVEAPLKGFAGDVLVLSGDVPLLRPSTVDQLISYHRSAPAAATLLTAIYEEPTGYGRILRSAPHAGQAGDVIGIVEQRDATEEQKMITEINTGIYVFDKDRLFEGLQHITPDNSQREYYLTDVFKYFWENHLPVRAVPVVDPVEAQGINTVEQLEGARGVYAHRKS
jgi:UDP-N-acetylglucosamine diphosphorylase/glucosamine-1-phosphate N-acetyltransferase